MNSLIIKSHLLVFLATMFIAGSFIVTEKLVGLVNPVSLILLRFLGASLILMPLVCYKRKWRDKVLSTLPRASLISFFYAAFFVGFFESLKTTTSLNTGTLFTLAPLITAVISVFLLKGKITARQVLVYLLGAIGTIWVVFKGQIDLLLSLSLNSGDILFMFAVVLLCCYSVCMKLLYRDDDMIVLVFCILLTGAVWMLLALLIMDLPLDWHLIRGGALLQMAYLIIFATLGTVYLYQITTIVLGPNRVNAYIYLNPALVALFLFIIEGVRIPGIIIPGVILSSIATVILQRE